MQDQDVERVLKSAGAREKPPAEVERAIREHLRAEWRATVAGRRARQQRRFGLALAAGLVAAAIGVWVAAPGTDVSGADIGHVAFADDGLRVKVGFFSDWNSAAAGQPLAAGAAVESAPTGHGALALADGVSARLDGGTRVTLASANELVLERGALYIDAGLEPATAARLDVTTPAGTVRHLGTQYEVRLIGSGVRLRVREGRVEWTSTAGAVAQGHSGEQLTIARDGSVGREATPLYGDSWAWIKATTPGIELEGLRLADFLHWAARELGCTVQFDRPETAREAESIVLHGSVSGLTPEKALTAVLGTTRVRATISGGVIAVTGPEASPRPAD